jgi:hypothetical protein
MAPDEPSPELTRENLYEAVWTVAMHVLAPRYGFSGRGLAKLCARERVPVPPRGYWAKVRAGHIVKRPPLPPAPPSTPTDAVVVSPPTAEERAAPEPKETFLPAIGELIDRLRAAGPVEVHATLRGHHPALTAAIQFRRENHWPRDSWYGSWPYRNPRYAPDLSKEQTQRALLLADALARHMTAHGATISAANARGVAFGGSVFGVSFAVWIYEPLRRLKKAKTKKGEEAASGYEHSGSLLLNIALDYFWTRGSWKDGSQRLEGRLHEVYPAVLREVDGELRQRDEREREEREEAERRRAWANEEARRREEERRRRTLMREVARWRRVELAREYVKAVERAATDAEGSEMGSATAAWTKWARAILDEMDPLKSRVSVAPTARPAP